MAGHSKWAQIKRQKGVADKKRGQLFSKISSQIALAARDGDNSQKNMKLRLVLDQAKKINMPKESIQRAIERGSGKIAGQKIEEILYEAYGPFGVAFLIETATDNRNRTTSEIKNILSKNDGKLAGSGSVSYLFEKIGEIIIKTVDDQDKIMFLAIDTGARDIDQEKDFMIIQTNLEDLQRIKIILEKQALVEEAKLTFKPRTTVFIEDLEKAQKILKLSNELEEVEEVLNVSSNFDISENILKTLVDNQQEVVNNE